MSALNYAAARDKLDACFAETARGLPPEALRLLREHEAAFGAVFASKTQSYREALLGCALAHWLCPEINVRLPYVKQGPDAFNGRTLDEQVVNPFLMSRQIPCSKGPYLATFRRNVRLDASTRAGLRDQAGYDAMLTVLDVIEGTRGGEAKWPVLCLLQKFMELREKSEIQLASVTRMSVEQYRVFLGALLHSQSGGLIPMLLTEAVFETLNRQFGCGWRIERQGVNAADGATGAPGDITIYQGDRIRKAIEVTERPIEQTRVMTTFHTKISTIGVTDYLFVYTSSPPSDGAYEAAKLYFAQGYDINFVKLSNLAALAFLTGGAEARAAFMDIMLSLLREPGVPASVKTAWNDALQTAIRA